jgi:hydroxymethylglutaryl-CoA lyase
MTGIEVEIRDVGPRDGLQVEAPVAVGERVALIRALAAAGVREIEVAAFVSPKAVPAMAGAAEVLADLADLDGVTRAALVPNARGAEDAVAAGADELTATVSASEGYSRRNVRMTVAESLTALERIVAIGAAQSTPTDAVISCCFGSPYESEIAASDVAAIVAACRVAGADRITLADTTGMATPRGIDEVLDAVGTDVGLHLHETRGTALVCAYAGLMRGVRRFDCSVGGLGGSPFAEGAAGNLATEGLVNLLDDLGVVTGIDLPALVGVAARLRDLVGHELPSPVARSGPRLPATG